MLVKMIVGSIPPMIALLVLFEPTSTSSYLIFGGILGFTINCIGE